MMYSCQYIRLHSRQNIKLFKGVLMPSVRTSHKHQNSNVNRLTGATCGIMSVRKTVRHVDVLRMSKRQDQHVEDSLTFCKKDGQTCRRYPNELNTVTARGMPLRHP